MWEDCEEEEEKKFFSYQNLILFLNPVFFFFHLIFNYYSISILYQLSPNKTKIHSLYASPLHDTDTDTNKLP